MAEYNVRKFDKNIAKDFVVEGYEKVVPIQLRMQELMVHNNGTLYIEGGKSRCTSGKRSY